MPDIPNILEFLQYFDFIRGIPAALTIAATAGVVFVIRDWRYSLLALAIQYLVAGFLFVDVLVPHLAFTKVLVGIFLCIILYISARQVNWGQLPVDVSEDEVVNTQEDRMLRLGPYRTSTEIPFRIFLLLMIVLATWSFAQTRAYQLPSVPDYFNIAIYVLGALGLFTVSLTSEPLKAGMGMLMFFSGFELFYAGIDQSLAVLAFLAVANVCLALVTAYLMAAQHDFSRLLD